jgi:hypothetical protein
LVSTIGHQLTGLRRLLSHAHAQQVADPEFRDEWSRHTGHDGTVEPADGTAVGPPPPSLDTGGPETPLVAVIGSFHDTTRARLQAGQACQRVALIAAAEGMSAASLSPVVQVPATRGDLRALLVGGIWPQAALHLGFAEDSQAHQPDRGTPVGG